MLAEFHSMADSSTTTGHIPILCFGGCWAYRELYCGRRDVSMRSILIELLSGLNWVAGWGQGMGERTRKPVYK